MKRDRLRGKDKVKYQIHDAVKATLPHCNSWSELCDRLAKQGIGVNFKLDRRNGNIVGVSFTKDGVSFNGSRIDRSMGFYRLDKLLGGRIAEGLGWRNNLYHTRPTAESGISQTETIYKPDKSFELTDKAYSTDGHAETSDSGTFADADANTGIVQVGINALIELCVQPHQAKVSSGGGGGGNDSDWGENDKEKNKYKPKKMKR